MCLGVSLLSMWGCAGVPQVPWRLEVTQAIGGDYQAVCLTEDHIALKSSFEVVVLRLDPDQDQASKSGRRLVLTRRLSLPQFEHSVIAPDYSSEVSHRRQVPVTSAPSPDLLCPEGGWLSLGDQGTLKTKWLGAELVVHRHTWRWGVNQRERMTRLRDLTSIPRKPSLEQRRVRQRELTRSYLIATERGLWRWSVGRAQALSEPLPTPIPQRLSRIVRDGRVWWVHTPDLSSSPLRPATHRGYNTVSNQRSIAWPIRIGGGPISLLDAGRSVTLQAQDLLAPISGRALRGKLDGLSLTWGQQHYPSAPLKALCVLDPQTVAVGTSRGVHILFGPTPLGEAPIDENTHRRLTIVARLPLPSATAQLLCERDALLMIGDYGLLYAELKLIDDAQSSEVSH